MHRRTALLGIGLAAVAALAALPAPARAGVPVRVRIVKATRQGPAALDPKLEDLKRQVSALAYVRWDLASDRTFDMEKGKTVFVDVPGGESAGLTLEEQRGDSVTFEVSLTQRNTQSRLTVEKGQRILHQVVPERSGAAHFMVVSTGP